MLKVGVIGYGYWGPNIVRNFAQQPEFNLVKICDKDQRRLTLAARNHPNIKTVDDEKQILNDPDIDLVAIVTPVYLHFTLAKKALENGKHVFVEKPFTSTSSQASELIDLAIQKKLLIMVDHTFLFTGAVKKMKELVESGSLGELYYYDSVRINLGLFQHDINVIWDLAPHDISIMNYMIPNLKPISVNSTGAGHVNKNLEDVGYMTVKFENEFTGHFHVNWLSPVKIRRTLLAGNKKMLVWDDLEPDHKIKIYDKGVDVTAKDDIYRLLVQYRSGDMYAPTVENSEALKLEAAYLAECILNNQKPINDGEAGLKVVKILEASDISLKNNGASVKL